MSEAQASAVRAIYEALSERDIERALGYASEQVVWDFSNSRAPYAGIYRGRREFADGMRKAFVEPWDEGVFEVQEIRELGDDRLAVAVSLRTRGREGIEVTAQGGLVFTFRDEEVIHIKMFQSFEEALAAAEQ